MNRSNTGVYILKGKRLVKISDEVKHPLCHTSVTFKEPFWTNVAGYPCRITSAKGKQRFMKDHGLCEPANSKDVGPLPHKAIKPTNEEEVKKFVSEHFKKNDLDRVTGITPDEGLNVEQIKDPIDKEVLTDALN